MEKQDIKFIASLASCMEILTKFTYELLSTIFYKNEPAMSEETLKEYRINCSKTAASVFINDNEKTDKLTDALDIFINELFDTDRLVINKDDYFEKGKDYKLKNTSFFKQEKLNHAIYKLSDEISDYVEDLNLNYNKDYKSFVYQYQMYSSILLQEFMFYLHNLNNASALDMDFFKRYVAVISNSNMYLSFTDSVGNVTYLTRNKKGEILTFESDGLLELITEENKSYLSLYEKVKSTRYDGIRAIVSIRELDILKEEIEKIKKEESQKLEIKNEGVKTVKKKEVIKDQSKKQPTKD